MIIIAIMINSCISRWLFPCETYSVTLNKCKYDM